MVSRSVFSCFRLKLCCLARSALASLSSGERFNLRPLRSRDARSRASAHQGVYRMPVFAMDSFRFVASDWTLPLPPSAIWRRCSALRGLPFFSSAIFFRASGVQWLRLGRPGSFSSPRAICSSVMASIFTCFSSSTTLRSLDAIWAVDMRSRAAWVRFWPKFVALIFAFVSSECTWPRFASDIRARVSADRDLPTFAADIFARVSGDTSRALHAFCKMIRASAYSVACWVSRHCGMCPYLLHHICLHAKQIFGSLGRANQSKRCAMKWSPALSLRWFSGQRLLSRNSGQIALGST